MTRSLFIVLAVFGLCASALGAPGEPLRTNAVLITWDPADPLENIDAYRLYFRTNLPPGMPLTNAPPGQTMQWTSTETSGWELYATIPGSSNQVIVARAPGVTAMFFVLTASNRLGESSFSNVAWTPSPPSHRDKNLFIAAEQ